MDSIFWRTPYGIRQWKLLQKRKYTNTTTNEKTENAAVGIEAPEEVEGVQAPVGEPQADTVPPN